MSNNVGILYCSLHGEVTGAITESEVPECCERHRKAGCPLALNWKEILHRGRRSQ